MRGRTLDELSAYLREDLGWRRKENKAVQSLVHGSGSLRKQAILRGAIASLYAHWEGFVKTGCRAYLEFVTIRKLRNCELSIPLLGLALKRTLKSVGGSDRLDSHLEFSAWLLREWDRRARLPSPEDIIQTSNLDSRVFKSYMLGLGLRYLPEFEIAEKPVIDALVQVRNNLAHGEWQIVSETAYDEWIVWIDRLMELVCQEIENAASCSSYRRALTQLA
jgi:MAE_28990/MAE_18760-like HEPN